MSEPHDSADFNAVDANGQRQILRSLWEPHPGQRAIMDHDARYRIVACGRRWGKSEMCAHLALERALSEPGATVWWCAPTYDQANEYGFDKIKPLLSLDVLDGEPKRTKPRKIHLTTGLTISFRSAEREDSLRGGGVDFLVIDEAGSVPKRAWTDDLRPTLADTQGDMIAVGTPKGRNWFHGWFRRGQSEDHPDVQSFQAPTRQNPHVPDSEVEAAREDMPDRRFRQEFRAEFVDNVGAVFTDVRDSVAKYALPVAPTDTEPPYAVGVDFARLSDWTVVVALDATGRLVAFDRLRETTWTRIQQRVEDIAGRYSPVSVAVDAIRDNKIVQDLETAGLNVTPVRFTASTKRTLVENLITELEADRLTLSADAIQLINELKVFEYDVTPAGNVRYAAPEGFHDNCIDTLALAVHAADPENSPTKSEVRRRSARKDRGTRRIIRRN